MEQRCETCQWWHDPADPPHVSWRWCYRYPPFPAFFVGAVAQRPRTMGFEHCGEWRPRADTDAPVSDKPTGMA